RPYYVSASILDRCVAVAEKDASVLGEDRKKLSKAYENRAKELICELIELWPDDPIALNNAAWFLATCAGLRLRDPVRAVELAEKAVKLAPRDAWNTLGVAYYRAGQWKKAISALEKSIELDPDPARPSGFNTFFLAMSQW